MGILIGMDEAGYGPNLGPLVVAATAWEVEEEAESGEREAVSSSPRLCRVVRRRRNDEAALSATFVQPMAAEGEGALIESDAMCVAGAIAPRQSWRLRALGDIDLYRVLRPVVARTAHEKRVPIADSKILYRPGFGLRQLERGLHAVLGAMEQNAACWSEVVEFCRADPNGHYRALCWHDGFDCALPVDATAEELAELGERFARACDKSGVRPMVICARLVFPAEFNELVEYHGTKGAALSHVTVGLLREVMERVGRIDESANPDGRSARRREVPPPGRAGGYPSDRNSGSVFAVCDKHGGRNFYTALLQHHFSEHWIEPVFEGAEESRYEWESNEARVGVSFRTRGEAFLPTALASMTAKYLRELAMRAFNEFWCARVPGLRPTAGYPMDSRRFKKAIAVEQRELGIADHVLWRSR